MSIAEVLMDTVKKAEENQHMNAEDYTGEDGLLYCGKCNTPKQITITLFENEKTVPCLCRCEANKRDEEEKRRKHEAKVKEMRRVGFYDDKMQSWTFANDDGENPKLSKVARNYAEYFKQHGRISRGLLLFGNVGSGKTYASACIANEVIEAGYSVCMTNFSRIANTVQGLFEGKQAYYDSFNRFSLLIIDDLSAERKTEFMQEIVFNVIDARYRAGLPLIVTTNLTGDELKHPEEIKNQRTFSRLFEMCHPVEVNFPDRRKKKLSSGFEEMKNILEVE